MNISSWDGRLSIQLSNALKISIFLIISVCLSACGLWNKTKQPADVVAVYSLFAPASNGGNENGEPVLYARAVLNSLGAACPILTGSDQSTVKMSERGFHPDRTNFPVTVCEAMISVGVSYRVSNSEFELAAATLAPSEVLVYGDTGCKASVCKPGEAASPFSKLAKAGATRGAELILHMGDYNYRGTSGSLKKKPEKIYAYDAGDGGYDGASCGYVGTPYYSQNASDSSKPDQWQYWYEDFFLPAQELLTTAPWVFARGNHELCSRAGVGWFYFFGPGSSLEGGISQLVCPNQGSIARPAYNAVNSINMIQPYVVSLEPLDLWVMDSANACDASSDNPLTSEFTQQFEQLQAQLPSNDKPVWMLTHRPTWGAEIDTSQSTPTAVSSLNVMLQTALKQSEGAAFASQVQLLLSGHMHLYQDISFPGSTRPPQIVIGNSGVSLNKSTTGNYQGTIDGKAAQVNQLDEFGYLLMSLKEQGQWQGEVLNEGGQVLVRCDSKNANTNQGLCVIDSTSSN
ncbi:metallophosphoesterase [Litoribrevibacter albus]|uniref:Calcineurin-like phosphoesterase domain-containing protein n=1 Tax=Litoribrevibacter albus TaxID=1473156 RepID=A0AA37W8Y0_9GAMM|nr:metallophosphoesterase [Litoribrevibacter albus]GLQ31991.1 hypothetical protein GCM10007876_24700 [Litoribrevibacter albus]